MCNYYFKFMQYIIIIVPQESIASLLISSHNIFKWCCFFVVFPRCLALTANVCAVAMSVTVFVPTHASSWGTITPTETSRGLSSVYSYTPASSCVPRLVASTVSSVLTAWPMFRALLFYFHGSHCTSSKTVILIGFFLGQVSLVMLMSCFKSYFESVSW